MRPDRRLAQPDQEIVPRDCNIEPELADAGAFVDALAEVARVAEARLGGLDGGGIDNGFETAGCEGVVLVAGGEEESWRRESNRSTGRAASGPGGEWWWWWWLA